MRYSRTLGCMLGGAVGDALGAPVASLRIDEIRASHSESGMVRFEEVYGRKGAITDDTRMAMFTAEGLILSRVRKEYAEKQATIPAIYHAYLRWLYTQDAHLQNQLIHTHGTCSVIDGILTGHKDLFSRRSPGKTCLSSLRSGGMGTMEHPINRSKGCGGLTRTAPIGLAYPDAEASFKLGCQAAAITHGHTTGFLAAGLLAALVSRLSSGEPIMDAAAEAIRILKMQMDHGGCIQAVEGVLALANGGSKPTPEVVETLGGGWTADEALTIGLYCTLVAAGDFRQGILLAVNHSGNSASTGSIAGNLLGAQLGVDAIPDEWLTDLEMKALIEEVATDLFERFTTCPPE
jgi:ADP-ribosyl-[dinitrogen reductase] hydrolase